MKIPSSICRSALLLLFGLSVVLPFAGCGSTTTTESLVDIEKEHVHGENDALVWALKEKIEGTDTEIWLGHHGEHFHPGDMIEPAAVILSGGEPMSDARISFYEGPNDPNVQVYGHEEMKFEPKTPEEPAHHAGVKMEVPKDAKEKLVICFRVQLPADAGGELIRDVEVKIGH